MTLEENDIVLCTVKRIEGTTVFLEIEDNSNTIQGTMIFSEVSPGRIRNIREYVVPNKKIVCKILRIKSDHPELSLRRVTAKERDEVLDHNKKEKILTKILKQVLKDITPETIKKIKQSHDLADFLDEARENTSILKKFVTAQQASELEKIFASSKDTKEKEVKIKIKLKSQDESGLEKIKQTLSIDDPSTNIYYLGSSNFSVSTKAKDYKTANSNLESVIEKIKENAKKLHVNLILKEK